MGPSYADRREFKKVISPTKQHQFRIDVTTQIRKSKKDDMLKRRRGMGIENSASIKEEAESVALGFKKVRLTGTEETVKLLMQQLRQFTSDTSTPVDETSFLEVLREIRRVSSIEDASPNVSKLLAHGILAYLYHHIQTKTNANILYEIVWILVNITSSKVTTHTEAVSTSGIVPYTANLLMHANSGVREQAIWFIANMAGGCYDHRSLLLEMNAVRNGLLHNFENPENSSILCNSAWAISNLFRGLQQEKMHYVVPFVPKLCSFLRQGVRGRVQVTEMVDLMEAMLSIVETGTDVISLVCEAGISSTIVDAIQNYSNLPKSTTILNTAIRILGNIAAGTEKQTEDVVQSGFLELAMPLLHPSKERIIHRSVLFTLSNIAAGTTEQINALLAQRNLTKNIVWMADNSPNEVKKEAIWTLANIITKGTLRQANRTVALGSVAALCNILRTPYDVKLVIVVLDAIEKLLKYNQSSDLGYISLVEYCNGVEAIEELQNLQNDEVYDKAVNIIVKYFDGEEEGLDDDQNLAPMISEDNATYTFGTTVTTSLPRKQLFPESTDVNPAGTIGASFTNSSTTFGGSTQMNKMFR